jgi:hypothetical protein
MDEVTFQKNEKRLPATKPVWIWQKTIVENYFPKLETYFNDVFPFRYSLIELYTSIYFKIGVSVKPDNIKIGKNGFLFLGNNISRVIDFITGKNLFTGNELKKWNNSFEYKKKYLEQRGIAFHLIFVPCKHSIYSEYLPDFIIPSDHNRLQQLIDSKPDYHIINTKQALLNAKKEWGDQLFYKSDSHWTEIGAYYAYLEIIKQLKPEFPDIQPIVLNKNNFKKIFYDWHGSMAGFMNLEAIIDDSIFTIVNVSNWNENVVRTNFAGDKLDVNEYPIIAYLDKSLVVNIKKKYTVLLLRDSYSMMLAPMFNNTFGKMIYCHYDQPEAIEFTNLVEKNKPDIVLFETVEYILEQNPRVFDNTYLITTK